MVDETCHRITGFPDHHGAWCFQFDSAITYGGIHIENMLQKTDSKGRPIHSIEGILGTQKEKRQYSNLRNIFGQRAPKGISVIRSSK